MPDNTQAEVLTELAGLAKDGKRGFYLIGKVKQLRRTVNEKTGEQKVKADTICGEGSTITLTFSPTATLPGVGMEGAFAIDNVREYMNKASADCLAFA